MLRTPIDSPEAERLYFDNEFALAEMRLSGASAAREVYASFLATDNDIAMVLERSR
jgi:hypothetical protein